MHCPKCKSTNFIKSGQIKGKQRFKCRSCNCQFTKNQKPGVSVALKMHATFLFLSGVSMNGVAKILDVAPPTVMRWINFFKEKLGKDFPDQCACFKEISTSKLQSSIKKAEHRLEVSCGQKSLYFAINNVTKGDMQ